MSLTLRSPRWLVEHGHYHRAQWSLCWFREGSHTEDEIKAELAKIQVSVQDQLASRPVWLSLFTHRDLFDRLWRASLLQFMSQMCGATAMKYYLPTLLGKLGVPTRVTLLIGGIESTSKIAMTVVEMLIIDRVGRRTTLVAGSTAMGIGMLVREFMMDIGITALTKRYQMNAVLGEIYPDNQNRAADIACIVFIFLYALGYSMGFGPASWVYGSEVSIHAWPKRAYIALRLTRIDLSHRSSGSWSEPFGIWRRHWFDSCCPGLAGRNRQNRFAHLLFLFRNQRHLHSSKCLVMAPSAL
jgi:hypothetical protein